MFSCTSDRKPCCGPKMAVRIGRSAFAGLPGFGETVGDVAQSGVDRGGVADDPDAAAVQAARRQQTVGSQRHRHRMIIEAPVTCF
jgi:hypothetical protein